jgi:arylsulfatase A-like enzyme
MRRYLLSAVLTGVLIVPAGCRRSDSAPTSAPGADVMEGGRPNILLVTLCTFRYTHMGAGGYRRPTTPFLDSLAGEGVFFENAVSASSWTKPSVASILTGLTPNVHGMTDMSGDREIIDGQYTPKRVLADEIVTLAECLRDAGYATAARINNVQAGEFFQMTQGFEDAVTSHRMDTAAMVNDLAGWLARLDRAKPFFFFMLTRDAHIPYDPKYEYFVRFNRSSKVIPENEYARYLTRMAEQARGIVEAGKPAPYDLRQRWIDLYDAELAQLDDALRRIPAVLRESGRASNTLIVVLADHGERFFEHGRIGHAMFLDEPVIHVPLILHGPNLPSGRRIKNVVRSIDLYPTLAAVTGAKPPDVLQGRNLLPLVLGDPDSLEPLTAFASFQGVEHVVRDGPYKFWCRPDGRRELFDLRRDPLELRDVAADHSDVAQRLEQRLAQWLHEEEVLRQVVAQAPTRELTPEVIEQLRALGYVR